MKRSLLVFLVSLVSISSIAQTDSSLQRRLGEYLALSKQLNFEKLMDYIHPNLFTIASKEQMVKVFKSAFNNEQMNISLDSLSATDVSSGFNYKGSLYKKVDYFISMSLRFKDSTVLKDEATRPMMLTQMKEGMNAEKVDYISADNRLEIASHKILIAIKDNGKEWMFLGYEEKQAALMQQLIPAEVLKNFKL